MQERDTTGALDLAVAWLVFHVLGVDFLLSPVNSLLDSLKDT